MKLYDVENGREQWYDPHTPSLEDQMFAEPEPDPVMETQQLHDALKLLTARQRFVIELRYGMRDGHVYTTREIAELTGISQQMVTQHEQAAVNRLNKHLVKTGLRA